MNSRSLANLLLFATATVCSCEKPESELSAEQEATAQPGDVVIAKLDSIIIPVIDFEDTSIEEAIDYLRVRSLELDRKGDPNLRGIPMLVWKSRTEGSNFDDDLSISDEALSTGIENYHARDVSLLEALRESCRLTRLDAYLTSVGIVICPEGTPPFPNEKAETGEVLRILTDDSP
ncbi:hypothetical protein [Haloferula rosea]|uniref:Uncharacterized protein n=1 Tax=Haloferula rosea TaxID=490093 RepID=A0A934VDZ6_9BACT|nr:hypothetical protein [Haloferula rosea]MBK1826789.1 hypothetical protein [Haloferula rosea]